MLVDAYAGSQEFAESARKEVEAIFGKIKPLDKSCEFVYGSFAGGTSIDKGIRFKLPARRFLRKTGLSPQGLKLGVVEINKRPAVIFSEFDLTGAVAGIRDYRAVGYKPESARRIVANILAYVVAE